jgi:DNA end-binding protein Ku
MARAFWKGAINFGLVVIPVKMYVATKSEKPSFHMLHKKDLTRVKQVLYCPKDNEYLSYEDTVRGYEYAKGQYVILTDSDFENVPVKTKHTIDVLSFVEAREIDPIYYYDAHFLEPEEIGARPYSLFRQALLDTGRVGIAKAAFQKQEHLCCIRPNERILVLHTLHYRHEVRSSDELSVPEEELKQEEIKMAKSLINEMAVEFKPEQYKDDYKNALKKLIEAKLGGKEVVTPEKPEAEEAADLLEALRQSIESRKKEKAGAGSRS